MIALRTQFHVERLWGQRLLSIVFLNVKAEVAAFNQEKALVGAFSVITNLRMELFEALLVTCVLRAGQRLPASRQHKSEAGSSNGRPLPLH